MAIASHCRTSLDTSFCFQSENFENLPTPGRVELLRKFQACLVGKHSLTKLCEITALLLNKNQDEITYLDIIEQLSELYRCNAATFYHTSLESRLVKQPDQYQFILTVDKKELFKTKWLTNTSEDYEDYCVCQLGLASVQAYKTYLASSNKIDFMHKRIKVLCCDDPSTELLLRGHSPYFSSTNYEKYIVVSQSEKEHQMLVYFRVRGALKEYVLNLNPLDSKYKQHDVEEYAVKELSKREYRNVQEFLGVHYLTHLDRYLVEAVRPLVDEFSNAVSLVKNEACWLKLSKVMVGKTNLALLVKSVTSKTLSDLVMSEEFETKTITDETTHLNPQAQVESTSEEELAGNQSYSRYKTNYYEKEEHVRRQHVKSKNKDFSKMKCCIYSSLDERESDIKRRLLGLTNESPQKKIAEQAMHQAKITAERIKLVYNDNRASRSFVQCLNEAMLNMKPDTRTDFWLRKCLAEHQTLKPIKLYLTEDKKQIECELLISGDNKTFRLNPPYACFASNVEQTDGEAAELAEKFFQGISEQPIETYLNSIFETSLDPFLYKLIRPNIEFFRKAHPDADFIHVLKLWKSVKLAKTNLADIVCMSDSPLQSLGFEVVPRWYKYFV